MTHNACLWCLFDCPQTLKTPSKMSDLNSREQRAWDRVRKHELKTNNELKTVMMKEWMNVNEEITKKVVKYISRHLKAVDGY